MFSFHHYHFILMKSCILFLVLMAFSFGCKSSTEPPSGNKLGSSVTVTSSSSPSLDGGGRWFTGADTGVWYDASLSYDLSNASGTDKDITYKIEIGLFGDGKFSHDPSAIFFDGDSIVTGSSPVHVSGNSKSSLNIQFTTGIGRLVTWKYPYGYRLTLFDKTKNDSLVLEGAFDGSIPGNRFHGIIYTTESSPDPLAILDGPDDGDWKSADSNEFIPRPLYPNPTSGQMSTLGWALQTEGLIISFSLNKTPKDSLFFYSTDPLSAGFHEYAVSLKGIKPGMYRIYLSAKRNSTTYLSHGDVMVSN